MDPIVWVTGVICMFLGAVITAICQGSYVTQTKFKEYKEEALAQCKDNREECHEHCEKIVKIRRLTIDQKLDKICAEIKEYRQQAKEVANFIGHVEQYIKDHPSGIRGDTI